MRRRSRDELAGCEMTVACTSSPRARILLAAAALLMAGCADSESEPEPDTGGAADVPVFEVGFDASSEPEDSGADADGPADVAEDSVPDDGGVVDLGDDDPDLAEDLPDGEADVVVACTTDADCAWGEGWCVGGVCEPCDNSGQVCDLACELGWELTERNGCTPCACAPVNECTGNADCADADAGQCYAGRFCWEWCPEGDPSCCRGNICGAPGCTEAPPTGCSLRGCPEGLECVPTERCFPGSCRCVDGSWVCDDDCGTSGVCLGCERDADCQFGVEWCVNGACVPCDDSGTACRITCPYDWTTYQRHGCTPCECAPPNECEGDDCPAEADGSPGTCYAGAQCWDWCPEGDPSCCRGNFCEAAGCEWPPPTGCTTRGCPEGESCRLGFGCTTSGCNCNGETWGCLRDCAGGICLPNCETDADCSFGAEWCVDGVCVPCDDTGNSCDLACPWDWAFYERNGCLACDCAPDNDCVEDADCADVVDGDPRCYAGAFCWDWCPAGDPSCCYGNTCSLAGCDWPSPVGCRVRGCPEGQTCEIGCASSGCFCNSTSSWMCLADCAGGVCQEE